MTQLYSGKKTIRAGASSRTALLVLSFLALGACTSVKKDGGDESPVPGAQTQNIIETEVSSEDVEKNIEKPYRSAYGEIALDYNPQVEMWLRYFQGRGRHHMVTYLERSSRYLPMMKNVLRENGLPEELVYIALIESGFSPQAHSRANAVGYWQFIRATGRRFGLTIDPLIDERRDPVLSTRAAAEYFKTLYGLFGSWHLAMASYNVGENRVKRAVTKHYTRDFWELTKKRRALPPETKHYVPKFIAAAMIAKDPAKYGFTDIDYQDPLSYDAVSLHNPISLSKLAGNLSVDVEELKLLNPKFRSDFVPISRGSETVVRIPVGRGSDAVAALSLSVSKEPKITVAENTYYRVKRGDTLSTIARKNRTTVSQLRRLNGYSNRLLLRAGMRVKVPDNQGAGVQYVTEYDTAKDISTERQKEGRKPAVDTQEVSVHIVRRGENLTNIASRYGLSVDELRKWNNFNSRSVIRKGQKIRLKADSSPKSAVKQETGKVMAMTQLQNERTASAKKRHTVRRGETLYDVSKRYGVALNRLARANQIKINHRVLAGERLLIPE